MIIAMTGMKKGNLSFKSAKKFISYGNEIEPGLCQSEMSDATFVSTTKKLSDFRTLFSRMGPK